MKKMPAKFHTILVVEDAKMIRLMLTEYFSNQYTVIGTDAGEHVHKLIEEKKPVLILLDIMLSGIVDGFSLLRMLKQDKQVLHIPIIIISSLDDKACIEKGLSLGANDYITKPFDLPMLSSKVANLITLSEANRNMLLNQLASEYEGKKGNQDMLTAFDSIIEDMIVNEKQLSILMIAQKLNLSQSTFERTIKRAYGLTPNRYILYRKLEKARLILKNTDMPIKQVVFMLGFNSVSYFTKCYKARFGELPSMHR